METQLGSFLVKRRNELGMTQTQLAEKLGPLSSKRDRPPSSQAISSWEVGRSPVPTSVLGKLSRALEVPEEELRRLRQPEPLAATDWVNRLYENMKELRNSMDGPAPTLRQTYAWRQAINVRRSFDELRENSGVCDADYGRLQSFLLENHQRGVFAASSDMDFEFWRRILVQKSLPAGTLYDETISGQWYLGNASRILIVGPDRGRGLHDDDLKDLGLILASFEDNRIGWLIVPDGLNGRYRRNERNDTEKWKLGAALHEIRPLLDTGRLDFALFSATKELAQAEVLTRFWWDVQDAATTSSDGRVAPPELSTTRELLYNRFLRATWDQEQIQRYMKVHRELIRLGKLTSSQFALYHKEECNKHKRLETAPDRGGKTLEKRAKELEGLIRDAKANWWLAEKSIS